MLPLTPLLVLLLADAAPAPAVNPQTYLIGVEDVLSVHVWKEPELTRRVAVRPDGKITLPLVQDVQAAGLTPVRLAAGLAEALRLHLTQAEVSVLVEQVNSKKFYVMGEVVKPGAYPLLAPISVLQALSTAGGFREFANTRKIQVLKGGRRLRFDYDAAMKGRRPQQSLLVEPGDTILVP